MAKYMPEAPSLTRTKEEIDQLSLSLTPLAFKEHFSIFRCRPCPNYMASVARVGEVVRSTVVRHDPAFVGSNGDGDLVRAVLVAVRNAMRRLEEDLLKADKTQADASVELSRDRFRGHLSPDKEADQTQD